jgi:hypothetical protein
MTSRELARTGQPTLHSEASPVRRHLLIAASLLAGLAIAIAGRVRAQLLIALVAVLAVVTALS